MPTILPLPSSGTPVFDPKTGVLSPIWQNYFLELETALTPDIPPIDASYLVATTSASLTAERLMTDTSTVEWDFSTPQQAKAHVPDDGITYGKIQNVTAGSRLLGRGSDGPGNPVEIQLGVHLAMSGTLLNLAGWVNVLPYQMF